MLYSKLTGTNLSVLFIVAMLSACSKTAELITDNTKSISQPANTKVVFVAGVDSHGPKAHEHEAGSRLLAQHLAQGMPDADIVVTTQGWPKDQRIFDNANTVVVYCDGGKHHVINQHLDTVDQLLDKKIGMVFIHYGVEVVKGSLASKKMLAASGGYFETHWSVNPTWTAQFTQLPDHAITRGVKPFEIKDEWYFNMRFTDNLKGITPILTAVPPVSTMARKNGPHSGNDAVRNMVAAKQAQMLAWAYQRPDGGRGFGFTGAHFHSNWDNENFRKIVLNAIAWTAGRDIPEQGFH